MIQWTSTRESLLNNSEYIDSSAENAESLWFSEPAPASHYSTTRNVSTLRQKMQKVYNPVNRQPPTTTQQPGIHRLFGRKCRKSIIWPIDIATVFYTTLCRSIVYSYFQMDDGCRGFNTNQPQVRVLKMNVEGNLLHCMSFVVGRGFVAVPGL